jgi:hypothetical protein
MSTTILLHGRNNGWLATCGTCDWRGFYTQMSATPGCPVHGLSALDFAEDGPISVRCFAANCTQMSLPVRYTSGVQGPRHFLCEAHTAERRAVHGW